MNRIQQIRAALRERATIHEAYQSIFNTPQGERVLHHLMKVGRVTTSSYVVGDPHQTAFNEGARHLVLSILRFVKKDHSEILKAIEEAKDEEQNAM